MSLCKISSYDSGRCFFPLQSYKIALSATVWVWERPHTQLPHNIFEENRSIVIFVWWERTMNQNCPFIIFRISFCHWYTWSHSADHYHYSKLLKNSLLFPCDFVILYLRKPLGWKMKCLEEFTTKSSCSFWIRIMNWMNKNIHRHIVPMVFK